MLVVWRLCRHLAMAEVAVGVWWGQSVSCYSRGAILGS